MDTNELKKLLKGSMAVLILEDGEPSFVILGYDAYKGLISDRPAPEVDIPLRRGGQSQEGQGDGSQRRSMSALGSRISEKEAGLLEEINRQILSLKGEIDKEEKSAEISSVD